MFRVASAVTPNSCILCAIPGHNQDLHPEEETTDQGTDAIPGLATEEEGTRTRNVITTPIAVVKISHKNSKTHVSSMLPQHHTSSHCM